MCSIFCVDISVRNIESRSESDCSIFIFTFKNVEICPKKLHLWEVLIFGQVLRGIAFLGGSEALFSSMKSAAESYRITQGVYGEHC